MERRRLTVVCSFFVSWHCPTCRGWSPVPTLQMFPGTPSWLHPTPARSLHLASLSVDRTAIEEGIINQIKDYILNMTGRGPAPPNKPGGRDGKDSTPSPTRTQPGMSRGSSGRESSTFVSVFQVPLEKNKVVEYPDGEFLSELLCSIQNINYQMLTYLFEYVALIRSQSNSSLWRRGADQMRLFHPRIRFQAFLGKRCFEVRALFSAVVFSSNSK